MKKIVLAALLVSTSLVTSASYAKEVKKPKEQEVHKIKGKVSLGYGGFSNIGITGASINDTGDEDEDTVDIDDLIDEDIFDDSELNDTNPTVDSGNMLETKVGAEYEYMFNKEREHTWNVAVNGTSNVFANRSDLNKKSYAITTGPTFVLCEALKISPTVTYLTFLKDGDKVLNSVIGSISAKYKMNKNLEYSAAYTFEQRDMDDPATPDVGVNSLSLGTSYKITKLDTIKFGVSSKFEDSDTATKNKNKLGFKVGYERELPWNLTAATVFAYNNSDFYNVDPSRDDDKYQWGISLSKEIVKDFDIGIGYQRDRKDSSAAGKNNNNEGVMVVITKKF